MYYIIITMKNSYFSHLILLFTFISFFNCTICTNEVNGITKTCSSNTFLCKDGVTCADKKLKCDGEKDCPDGSDEENCVKPISNVNFCKNVKKNSNWKCQNSESCWYYTKYKNESRLDDYTPIQRCTYAKHGICCPAKIMGSSFCTQVKNLSGWECKSKSECLHYDVTKNQNTSSDIRCSGTKICCPPKKCGISPLADSQLSPKIIGGTNAKFGAWPWQVSLRKTFNGFSSKHFCGGVLLNENWIVTAAHCVEDLLLSEIKIRFGEHDFSSIQEPLHFVELGVAEQVVHPKYDSATGQYDLAMLRLNSPIEYAPHIVPICLPEFDDLLIGENATVTGWGRLRLYGSSTSVLQEVSVPVVSNDECKSMYRKALKLYEHISDITMCAGSANDSRGACYGDSGGPLQIKGKDGRYFLAGTVWKGWCAQPNLPVVFMRISKFVPWILETINGHVIQ